MFLPQWNVTSDAAVGVAMTTASPPGLALTVDRVLGCAFLALVGALALVGNISLWTIVLRTASLRREPSSWLMLCLSVADLLVATVSMPLVGVALVSGDWPLSDAVCVVFGFVAMISFVASVMSLVAISLDRYGIVCYPQKYSKHRRRVALSAIAGRRPATASGRMRLGPPHLRSKGLPYYLGQTFCSFIFFNNNFHVTSLHLM